MLFFLIQKIFAYVFAYAVSTAKMTSVKWLRSFFSPLMSGIWADLHGSSHNFSIMNHLCQSSQKQLLAVDEWFDNRCLLPHFVKRGVTLRALTTGVRDSTFSQAGKLYLSLYTFLNERYTVCLERFSNDRGETHAQNWPAHSLVALNNSLDFKCWWPVECYELENSLFHLQQFQIGILSKLHLWSDMGQLPCSKTGAKFPEPMHSVCNPKWFAKTPQAVREMSCIDFLTCG